MSHSKIEESTARQIVCKLECVYYKKYKKVKQKAKNILREKRELANNEENKNEKMIEKNEIL